MNSGSAIPCFDRTNPCNSLILKKMAALTYEAKMVSQKPEQFLRTINFMQHKGKGEANDLDEHKLRCFEFHIDKGRFTAILYAKLPSIFNKVIFLAHSFLIYKDAYTASSFTPFSEKIKIMTTSDC